MLRDAVDAGGNSRRLRRVAGGRESRGRFRVETRSAGPRSETRAAQSRDRHGPVHIAAARHWPRRPRRLRRRRAERRGRGGAGRGFGPAAIASEFAFAPVRTMPTGRTSGTRSRSSSTPTTCARGSTMDRKAEAPTARPTTTSPSTDRWRCTSAARAKSASSKSSSKISAGAFCRTNRCPADSACSASTTSTTPGPRRRPISITTASWTSSPVPFYYLGPDYRVSREIYPSKTSTVGTEYTPAHGQLRLRLHRRRLAGRSGRQLAGRCRSTSTRRASCAAGISTTCCRPSIPRLRSSRISTAMASPTSCFVGGGAVSWAGRRSRQSDGALVGSCRFGAGLRRCGAARNRRGRHQRRWAHGHRVALRVGGSSRLRERRPDRGPTIRDAGPLAARRCEPRRRGDGRLRRERRRSE